ncbi:MAG: AI-2E family transporter [Rhodopseudomonas palustris]|nr:AI-2E family transporter [Rhodopseudomonas palustris]
MPASLVLVSPAIRVHPASALARFKDALSVLPGLEDLAYLAVMSRFDPFSYNSFATNAGAQVHALTRNVDRRIRTLVQEPAKARAFPPVLALKSTVDATVTTEAIVDHLLKRLPGRRNELVLFDINRHAAIASSLLVADPAPLTDRLMAEERLPFAVTFVTNESPESAKVVARYKGPFSPQASSTRPLGLVWPSGMVSLSHVALAFPPDDPLYGRGPADGGDRIFLGDMALEGRAGAGAHSRRLAAAAALQPLLPVPGSTDPAMAGSQERIMNVLASFSPAARGLIVTAAIAIVLLFLQAAESVVAPILLAAFIAIVAAPPLRWMQRKGVPKWGALALIAFVLLDAGSLFGLIATGALEGFKDSLPGYQERLAMLNEQLGQWLEGKGIASSTQAMPDILDPPWRVAWSVSR